MKTRKNIILMTIGAITLIAVVLGATYAYFVAQGGGSSNTNVNVQTNTTDNLSFQVGDDINITANQENFANGLGNISDTTTARATLIANNATNNATANYYMYLSIATNNFIYTVDENTPELILTVIDSEGNPVTEISGLTYKENVTTNLTNGETQVISGFDITEASGLITIANNHEIVSTGTEVQEWQVTITFINLDTDQQGNTNKTLEAKIILSAEPFESIDLNEVYTYTTSNSVKIRALSNSNNTNLSYYYSIDGGDNYVGPVSSNSYTFTEGITPETTYDVSVYAEDTYGNSSTIYSSSVTTKDTIDEQYTLSSFDSLSSYYSQITNIIFEKGTGGHSGSIATIDMSDNQNGLIMAYLMDDGTLYIQAAKTIVLSSNLLTDMEWIKTNNVAKISGDNVYFPNSIPIRMFSEYTTILDWKNWDFSGLTTIGIAAFASYQVDYIDWSDMNVSSLTLIGGSTFSIITADYVDLSGWDTSSLTLIGGGAFSSITADYVDLSGWDTSSLTEIGGNAFANITAEYVDLRGWDLTNVSVGFGAFADNGTGTIYYVSNEATKEIVEMYGATAIIME